MNEKTAKTLNKYARFSGQNNKELKAWWNQLNWIERTAERKRILAEMAAEAQSEEATDETDAE